MWVALRKESVDRNVKIYLAGPPAVVALRKESVDRNSRVMLKSFSAPVALRKESVDRNAGWLVGFSRVVRRSPQGERG